MILSNRMRRDFLDFDGHHNHIYTDDGLNGLIKAGGKDDFVYRDGPARIWKM